jgi:hypothetical protein
MTALSLVQDSIYPLDGTSDSLLVTCASYEERSMLTIQRLAAQYRAEHTVLCCALEYREKGKTPRHFDLIRKGLTPLSDDEPEELFFSVEDPIGFIRDLAGRVSRQLTSSPFRSVTIDITTFPRQELLLLLKYFDSQVKPGNLRLLYGEPKSYATEAPRKQDRWLTRGVKSVHAVPGFCGIQYPQLSKLLVIILGHEGERTLITLRRHQPDKVILLRQGEKQYHAGLSEIADGENRNMILQFGERCFWERRLPAHGIWETREELERIFQSHRYRYNVFIAPNGTKLQLVGTYLAAREFSELQITYATPALYNWGKYSSGTGALWAVRLKSPEDIGQQA